MLCFLLAHPNSAFATQVVAWGRNGSGQLNVPPELTNAVAVSVCGYASLALRADGTVTGWGNDSNGQATPPADLTNVIAISGGWVHALALRADGTVAGWGSDFYGETTIPAGLSNVVAIGAGEYTSAALRGDGTVVCWGSNDQGFTNVPPSLTNVVAIAVGFHHVLALHNDGGLSTWGDYWNEVEYVPLVTPPGLSNIVAVGAGYAFSMVLLADGSTVAWSPNWWSGVVSGSTGRSNLVAIAAGAEHVLGLNWDGAVSAWGNPAHGATTVPEGLTNVVAISAGGSDGLNHSLALVGGGPAFPSPRLSIGRNGGSVVIVLSGKPLARYVIEQATRLGPDANWSFLQNVFLIEAAQALPTWTPAPAGPRFFRARFVP